MTTNLEVYAVFKQWKGKKCTPALEYCHLGRNESWCDAMLTYSFYKAGGKKLYCNGAKETYCPHSIAWCKANLAQLPLYLAMKADPIFFDWEPNGRPNHVGIVEERKSTSAINTIEGNTSGGIVDTKCRPKKYVQGIFRPHYTAKYDATKPLKIDGQFDYNSIALLQKALGLKVNGILSKATVKALQKKAKANPDGAWGEKTSKAIQKNICGFTSKKDVDGAFGINSVKALQRWINKKNNNVKPATTPVPTPTEPKPVEPPAEQVVLKKTYSGTFPSIKQKKERGSEIADEIKKLAWAYGTAKKKYEYKSGAAKAACKTAMAKYGWKKKADQSDCGHALETSVRETGIDKKFDILPTSPKNDFPKLSPEFEIVWEGKFIDPKILKIGDLIAYKKNNKKSQHALAWMGNNKIAEAGRKIRFFVIKTGLVKVGKKYVLKFNRSNVDEKTIRVLRAKPIPVNYICEGMEGTDVKYLQKYLNWYGNYGLKIDGEFGDNTLLAVKDFQKKEGLKVDGEFGQASLDKAKTITR